MICLFRFKYIPSLFTLSKFSVQFPPVLLHASAFDIISETISFYIHNALNGRTISASLFVMWAQCWIYSHAYIMSCSPSSTHIKTCFSQTLYLYTVNIILPTHFSSIPYDSMEFALPNFNNITTILLRGLILKIRLYTVNICHIWTSRFLSLTARLWTICRSLCFFPPITWVYSILVFTP